MHKLCSDKLQSFFSYSFLQTRAGRENFVPCSVTSKQWVKENSVPASAREEIYFGAELSESSLRKLSHFLRAAREEIAKPCGGKASTKRGWLLRGFFSESVREENASKALSKDNEINYTMSNQELFEGKFCLPLSFIPLGAQVPPLQYFLFMDQLSFRLEARLSVVMCDYHPRDGITPINCQSVKQSHRWFCQRNQFFVVVAESWCRVVGASHGNAEKAETYFENLGFLWSRVAQISYLVEYWNIGFVDYRLDLEICFR